jgi:hypothetical protein
MMIGSAPAWSSWSALLESVRTGEAAFPKVHGMSNWEYRLRHPEEQALFDTAMGVASAAATAAIVAAYDFDQLSVLADIAGGNGTLLAAILSANPGLHGVLFDQEQVVAHAVPVLLAAGVMDRCQIVGGDFFDALPRGPDGYLLKSILHDWDDDQAIKILANCRAAMEPGARCLIVEVAVEGPNQPDRSKFLDIRMLVLNGGRERTTTELAQLLRAAGFEPGRVVNTRSPFKIVEGLAT